MDSRLTAAPFGAPQLQKWEELLGSRHQTGTPASRPVAAKDVLVPTLAREDFPTPGGSGEGGRGHSTSRKLQPKARYALVYAALTTLPRARPSSGLPHSPTLPFLSLGVCLGLGVTVCSCSGRLSSAADPPIPLLSRHSQHHRRPGAEHPSRSALWLKAPLHPLKSSQTGPAQTVEEAPPPVPEPQLH